MTKIIAAKFRMYKRIQALINSNEEKEDNEIERNIKYRRSRQATTKNRRAEPERHWKRRT